MEKRSHEASALRAFFREQWGFLLQLITIGPNHSVDEMLQQQKVSAAIELIVEKVDSRFRAIGSYREQLRVSARELLQHIRTIVEELPPAITIDKHSYINEPLINAAFTSNGELERLIKGSDEISKFAREHLQISDFGLYVPDFYALLFMVREEEQIFGSEIQKGVMQRDVAQTAVNFSCQQLVAPSLDEASVRSALENILFESTIATLRSNMVKLRHSLSSEEQLAAALNPSQNINNPEVYLKLLKDQLGSPRELISMHSDMLRVSRMGIKLPEGGAALSDELNLHEVSIGESHSKVVLLVKLDHSEWL